jgi:hypothetical protein
MRTWNHCRAALLGGLLLANAATICLGMLGTLTARTQLAQGSASTPEEVLEASLRRAFQEANLPYRNLHLMVLANDGAVARFRVVVELRPDATRPWEENEREIEVHYSEGGWQAPHIPPYFAWQFSADERARRADLVRVEVLQTTLPVDPIERVVSVPLRVTNADTWGHTSLFFRATFRDVDGRVLQGPSGEVAWEAGAGPLIVPWGTAEEYSVRLFVAPPAGGGALPLTLDLTQYDVRRGWDGPWEGAHP